MMRWFPFVLALLVASPVLAQPAQPAQQQPQLERREKIKKRIRALRAYTLTEELSLDEQTAGKLFPLLAKYDDEFDKLLVARVDLEKRLFEADTLKDGKAVDKLIDEAAANQKALWDTETKRLGELRKILTPQQVAKTLVVLPKMERQIQNQLRKAAMTKQKGQAGAGAKQGKQGEVLEDPFADDEGPVDPYAKPPPHKKADKVQGTKKPCDPFSSFHSCAD